MQNIINKFLFIEHLHLIEDIQKLFKKVVFDRYLLDMAKILVDKSDSRVALPIWPYRITRSTSRLENLDYDTLMIKFLQALKIDLKLTFDRNTIRANSSCDDDIYYVCFAAQVFKREIKIFGKMCLKYKKDIDVFFLFHSDIGDLRELILHQNKFFKTFMDRFRDHDKAKYKEDAPKFVEEFPIL